MSDNKVWFITGAGCGMGADIFKAALAAGYKKRGYRTYLVFTKQEQIEKQ